MTDSSSEPEASSDSDDDRSSAMSLPLEAVMAWRWTNSVIVRLVLVSESAGFGVANVIADFSAVCEPIAKLFGRVSRERTCRCFPTIFGSIDAEVLSGDAALDLLVSSMETSKLADPWRLGFAFRDLVAFLLVEVNDPPEIMAAKGLRACWEFSGPTNELLLAPVLTGVSRVDCGTWTPVLGPFWGSNPVGVLPGLATLDVFEGFEVLSDLEGLSDFRFDPVVGISVTFML
jgi:hypothetical protein